MTCPHCGRRIAEGVMCADCADAISTNEIFEGLTFDGRLPDDAVLPIYLGGPVLLAAVLGITLLSLAGCTTPRDVSPDVAARSPASAEDTVACLVRELDARFPGSRFMGGLDHHALLIVPGKVYEVTTVQSISLYADSYFVQVAAVDGGSTMELRAPRNWVHNLRPAVERCGEVVAVADR